MKLLLLRLASLRLTALLLSCFGLTILVVALGQFRYAPVVAGFLALLSLNLLATILTNPRFRQSRALFVFHLSLLGIVVLVALGQMIYLNGEVELVDGVPFDGELNKAEVGPWHPWHLKAVSFVNHGFTVAYAPGLQRMQTKNKVSWVESDGQTREAVIGDDKPLVLAGYRFYTTWNKGFALMFEWSQPNGENSIGSVNLPSFPANALKQAQEWHLPGLDGPLWAMLQFEGELIPLDRDGHFRLPDDYRVVVRHGNQRWELLPENGQTLDLPGGKLRFVELRTWMGYRVRWDATIPWLLAVSTIAVLALSFHFFQQFSRRPWHQDGNTETNGPLARE